MDRIAEFWEACLWTDETKLDIFGHMDQWYIWREKGLAYDQKNPICTVKQGGG